MPGDVCSHDHDCGGEDCGSSSLHPFINHPRITAWNAQDDAAAQRVFLSLPYSSSGGKSAFERTGSRDRQRCHLGAALGTAGALHAIDAAGSNTWSHPPLSLLRIGSAAPRLPLLASSASRHPGN